MIKNEQKEKNIDHIKAFRRKISFDLSCYIWLVACGLFARQLLHLPDMVSISILVIAIFNSCLTINELYSFWKSEQKSKCKLFTFFSQSIAIILISICLIILIVDQMK